MNNKFGFEDYPNYRFFKDNMVRRSFMSENEEKCSQIQVQQVVTEKSLSTVIEFSQPFPIKYPAYEIIDSATSVKNISSYILKDTVLISGYIHKRISYVCFEGSYKCRDSDIIKASTVGSIKVLCSDVPFSCSTRITYIQPNDSINIEYAGADASNVIDIPDDPIIMSQDKVTLYKSLKEKLVLDIDFTILRKIQTKL